jgi:hypothetical protein
MPDAIENVEQKIKLRPEGKSKSIEPRKVIK